ncbi:MAG: endonuclease MutS2 [Chloroherpetonaceae bacterium]|nr:endonuclease MutS2 [Chthonomonadaceae bacterium]MDW8208156.1 endonuclease MutS2 [Chloroherpetonaceae bacterium]
MDEHSLRVLEYHRIIERLMQHTSNRIGRDFARDLLPLPYPETVTRRLQETREARLLRETDSGLPLGGIHDIRDLLERARIGTRLAPHELLAVRDTVSAGKRLRQYLLNRQEKVPLLAETASNIPVLNLIEQRISDCISDGGEVRDTASPELARVRNQWKVTSARLQDRLHALLNNERYRPMVQEAVITMREGRYCIPVKAEFARAFGGIVHGASSSGATVFLEPHQTVELGNTLKQLQLQEEQEVERILRDLSGLVGSFHDEGQRLASLLGHLDVVHARAILAAEMDASEPRLNRRGFVRLVQARHPLLTGAVVPIDIELGDRFTTLLITGPNTGGKTVTLKTLGLLTLMTLAGFQIPASPESEIALFEQVFADIGDEQDIQQSLSTFSAHLKNIVQILRTLGDNALVLLDEVGAGTDPAEGAALARALLDYLMMHNARVVATTHYGELKEYAYTRPGVENASVEFDRETLSPTYRVLLGVPGSSHAFYIATRIGLPEEIVETARSYLSRREMEIGELLQQIEQSRKAAAEAEATAQRDREEAARLRAEYQTRVQQIAEVQRTVRSQAQEEARQILRRAEERAENIVKELQRMNKGARKGASARQRLNALRAETYAALRHEEPVEEEALAPAGNEAGVEPVYRPGDTVRVIGWNMDAQVLDGVRDGLVEVQVGAMRVKLPVEQLRPTKPRQETTRPAAIASGAAQIALQKALHISPELNLVALRADEAQSLLDKYVDDALAAGLSSARIVHGKGSGVLRRVVHDFLSGHPGVAALRPGNEAEGGDGVTLVTFKT